MGNNETKLRRKYLLVCLVGGYIGAIIVYIIIINVF